MRYITIVYVFSIIISVAHFKVFRKCCTKNQSLIKVSRLDKNSRDKYECIDYDRHLSEYKEASLNSDLVVNQNVIIDNGIPQKCNLSAIELYGQLNASTDRDICYDRIITEINNGMIIQAAKQSIIMLKCDGSNLTSRNKLKLQGIVKCCPRDQVYDSEYHLCRKRHEFKEEWLISQLTLNICDIFFIENKMDDCDLGEYSVEIKEGVYRLALINKVLEITKENGDEYYIKSGSWCVDQDYMSRRLLAKVCILDCSEFDAYCMRKCCPIGEHISRYGTRNFSCAQNSDDRFLFNLSSYIEPLRRKKGDIGDVMGIRASLECSDESAQLQIYNSSWIADQHSLDMNGWLRSRDVLTDEYCLDSFKTSTGKTEVMAITCVTFADYNLTLLEVLLPPLVSRPRRRR
ncbi:unnamed protein product [Diatraea saccharalis]|uniref:Uncharacterized protein n=1 Tax=Diatraea saccharalis TaxID=40085 RepID=A0A9N9R8M3_9NEOP|nr:unnamed protein product [Diatraea saccharalis]